MSPNCGDEFYFISQICSYNDTVHDSDSFVVCLSDQASASDQCRDQICVTMDAAGFPCQSYQGGTENNSRILSKFKQLQKMMLVSCK